VDNRAVNTLIALALVLLAAGCDDDPGGPAPLRHTSIYVVDAVTGEPVPGVELLLYDVDAGFAAAPPSTTSASGWATVEGLGAGEHRWLVMPGRGWVSATPPPRAMVFSGNAVPPVVPTLAILPAFRGGEPVVSGVVVDRVTGDPIRGAVVGFPNLPTAWDGLNELTGDVTGDDGAFRVEEVFFARDPGSDDDPIQVIPLVFQARGYRPLSLRFDAPGDGNVVRLTALEDDGADVGSVTGRVVDRNGAVAGLGVVGTWFAPAGKGWLSHPGVVTRTDEQGRFVLEDLAAGNWLVEPGYLPADGWSFVYDRFGSETLPVVVASGAAADVGDLEVLPGVSPVWPAPGATAVDSLPVFRWSAVAEADSYDVFLGRWWLGRTAADSLAVPEDSPLDQGAWFWTINALTADGDRVATGETLFRFVVGPFDD